MKACSLFIFATMLCLCASSHAQPTKFKVAFTAKCAYTNAAGKIVMRPISTRAILKECAVKAGVTNVNSLSLIYHVSADSRGDLIEVVRNSDGTVVCPVFSLFYPTLTNLFDGSFAHVSNTNGTSAQRFFYIFSSQSSHSVGTVLLNEKLPLDPAAKNARYNFQGKLQYFLLPTGNSALSICNGKITATKPFIPKNAQ